MQFNSIIPDIIMHGKDSYPNECCGVVIVFKGRLRYIRCTNLLSGDIFCIDPQDFSAAEDLGEVVAIAHSHPNIPASPSQADIIACNRSGIPWIIVSIPSEEHYLLNPEEFNVPLVGRQFFHGVLDCYSLIRDYYKQELNIDLNDYPREPEWWNKGQNLYLENFKKENFLEVNTAEKHDIILMQNGSDTVNHGGIYLGDSIILHHSPNRLSSRDVYGGYWRKNTRLILRHRSLL